MTDEGTPQEYAKGYAHGYEDGKAAAGVTLAPTPPDALPGHQTPGEFHDYRVACVKCGEPGYLHVSWRPETYTAPGCSICGDPAAHNLSDHGGFHTYTPGVKEEADRGFDDAGDCDDPKNELANIAWQRAEAVAAERARIVAAVAGLPGYPDGLRPTSVRRETVLRIIEETS